MRLVVHSPGEMVYGAHAPSAATLVGRFADIHVAGCLSEPVASPLALAADTVEAERIGEEAARDGVVVLPQPRPV